MKPIAFIDLEVNPGTGIILDIGCIINNSEGILHSKSTVFLNGADYLCGHNIVNHDLKYIQDIVEKARIAPKNIIDTLYLSALLFPRKPYHALLKDEKLQSGELNNPVNDALKTKDLFFDEVNAFFSLEDSLKKIFFLLLKDKHGFSGFFKYVNYSFPPEDPVPLIKAHFADEICGNADLNSIVKKYPVPLAYCLASINIKDRFSITPPWVLKNYPETDRVMDLLRNLPCLSGCPYCYKAQDPCRALKYYFGYDSYRTFGGEPLQEKSARAAISNKSLLAIFPTGGGKSMLFRFPP